MMDNVIIPETFPKSDGIGASSIDVPPDEIQSPQDVKSGLSDLKEKEIINDQVSLRDLKEKLLNMLRN